MTVGAGARITRVARAHSQPASHPQNVDSVSQAAAAAVR
jgi:hypothetical protein